MQEKLELLKTKLREVNDINAAAAVLNWDQATYMPPGGAAARGRQLATLQRISHAKFASDEMGKLLEELEPYAESLPADSDDAAMIRLTRRGYDRAVKIPGNLLGEFASHSAQSYQDWAQARPKNDFASVVPNLEKTLELSMKFAECFPGYEHIADPLIDNSDYGMKASSVRKVFGELREQLVPIVAAITEQAPADASCLFQHYPVEDQKKFGLMVIGDYGFDFQRGRQDLTHHPFMTKFSLGDVRITTRFDENNIGDGLFSTMHESGHAMYELGINRAYEGLPLAGGTSSGVHESQSRLWENVVGRSRKFWQFYYPKLQDMFPSQLSDVSLDTFYAAINKVERSLIRVDADEVTYNLHVMLRFELEMQMLDGTLAIKDLAEAWREQFQADFGIVVPDDKDGALQDVHWFAGIIGGAFQGYTLGNIMSALFYNEALKAQPNIPDEIGQGKFDTLHSWMRENIYQYGSKYTANELIQRVTGGELVIDPYISYLKTKYGELYDL